jgi:hypothetical protein
MIGAIPNPTKSLTIQFPLDQVKTAARNINKVMSFCHFREENEIFNSYKFSRTEFLSFGAFINIHLKKVDELTTQIDIEISRQMGAFDDWVEVSKANRHLDETMKAISEILTNGLPAPKQVEESTKQLTPSQNQHDSIIPILIGLVVGMGGMLWIFNHLF